MSQSFTSLWMGTLPVAICRQGSSARATVCDSARLSRAAPNPDCMHDNAQARR